MWIFFILAGYLAGAGYAEGRYSFSVKSILAFYLKKYLSVALPTSLFYMFVELMLEPDYCLNNIPAIIRRLLLVFQRYPTGTFVIWYVTTLMCLFIVAPLMCMLCERIKKRFHKRALTVYGILLAAVLIAGLAARLYCHLQMLDWARYIYRPAYMNADLFMTGILCAYILRETVENADIQRIKAGKTLGWTAPYRQCLSLLQGWN